MQSSNAPAPGPASGAAYAPGPANSNSQRSNSSGNGNSNGGGFGPDTSGANYQTVLAAVQYDPGTAELLGAVVGNLSNTIMAGTNLTVRPPALQRAGCTDQDCSCMQNLRLPRSVCWLRHF